MTTTDYPYTASGLDNVILRGLRVLTDDAADVVIGIPNINGLYQLLAREVATKSTGLRPKEVRFLRTQLGMTQAELAQVVGRDTQTVGRRERGETAPDQSEEVVIRALALEFVGGRQAVPEMIALARMTTKSASDQPFIIDASDPENYRPVEPLAA
jgi:DNA-binding transcriptional regulator YiaG